MPANNASTPKSSFPTGRATFATVSRCSSPSRAGGCSWSRTSTTTRSGGTRRRPTPRPGARAIQYRAPFQEPGLALVKSHLEMARRDPDYKFVLAELDYLKPYWDAYPEDRDYVRQLLADGRLEFDGRHLQRAEHEPHERRIHDPQRDLRHRLPARRPGRRAGHGVAARCVRARPAVPRDHGRRGLTSSSWARGPFHEWGPNWVRGPGRMPFAELAGRRASADAVPDGVRLDRAQRAGAADELHGRPLLGRLVDGRRADARGGRGARSIACSPSWRPSRPRRTSSCRSARTTRRRTSGSPRSTATGTAATSGRSSSRPSRATTSTPCAPNRPRPGARSRRRRAT